MSTCVIFYRCCCGRSGAGVAVAVDAGVFCRDNHHLPPPTTSCQPIKGAPSIRLPSPEFLTTAVPPHLFSYTPDLCRFSSQACPRGAVGVGGVDLAPVSSAKTGPAPGDGQEEAEAEALHRFSCVGAELPMLMRRDGATRVHEVCGVDVSVKAFDRLPPPPPSLPPVAWHPCFLTGANSQTQTL